MTLLVARKCLALGARHSKGFASETFRGPVVLAVEDEPLILMLAVDMIRDAGFEPLWASNAEEAISILESRDDIRIVFTDINMPGSMDGIKLAQAVRGRWPPIRIIVTSRFGAGELKLLPEGSQLSRSLIAPVRYPARFTALRPESRGLRAVRMARSLTKPRMFV